MLNVSSPKPWVAAALSMLCTGLGQIYCGRGARGLAMFGATLLFGPLVIAAMLFGTSLGGLVLLLATVLAVTAVYIGSVINAHRLAKQLAGQPFAQRRYNRPAVYWLMALASVPATFGVAMLLRANVVGAYYIPASSMAPTLLNGDRILVNKLDIATRELHRGDLAVFHNPKNREQTFVKRVIGLPGDTVELKRGAVLINGVALRREAVDDAKPSDRTPRPFYEWSDAHRYQVLVGDADENADFAPQTVPEGSFFMLGDHRGLSHDSRKIGPISRSDLVGIVTWIYSPAGSWERFGGVE